MADDTAPKDAGELTPVTVLLPWKAYISAVWDRRLFATVAPRYELTSQNLNRFLGNVWLVLNPLLQVLVYYLFFGVLVGTRGGVEHFVSFLSIGVFVFSFSQRSIVSNALSIHQNLGLIRSLRFPRALLPLSSTLSNAVAYLPVLIVMLVVVLADAGLPGLSVVLLPGVVLLQILFHLGTGFIVARLNTAVPDTENILSFLFRLVFYMSGILYSIDVYVDDPTLRELFAINPFYAFITVTRSTLIGVDAGPAIWASVLIWTAASLVFGFEYFRRGELGYGRG